MRIVMAMLVLAIAPLVSATPTLTPSQRVQIEQGEVVVQLLKPTDDSGVAARAIAVIKAPPKDVWPVLRDCQHYKDFMPRTQASEVRSRVGHMQICYTKVDMPFPFSDLWAEVKSVEKIGDDGSFARRWSLIKGTYRRNNGSWTVRPWGSGGDHSLIVYQVDLDPETNVPDFIIRKAQTSTLPDVFDAIRKRVRTVR
ncbi:MAG: SRPBCC family protein [Myxococcota bacterium]|nr:SRPBCC family protein [Myxococcota bacterium]